MVIKTGRQNDIECFKLEKSDINFHWSRNNGKGSIRTGDNFLNGIIVEIKKNDCFSSFVTIKDKNNDIRIVLVS